MKELYCTQTSLGNISPLQLNWNKMLSLLTCPMKNEPKSCGYLFLPVHRLYFTLKKKTSAMSVTVSPCSLPIEWSLAAHTLKDKPLKNLQCEWTNCTFLNPEVHHQILLSWDNQLDIIVTLSGLFGGVADLNFGCDCKREVTLGRRIHKQHYCMDYEDEFYRHCLKG